MPRGGRIVECGQIATYDRPGGGWSIDIKPIHHRGLRLEGFTRSQYDDFLPAANGQLAHWLRTGRVAALETERYGLEELPGAYLGMLRGENVGKMVVNLDS
jgi:NADPH-dependent curcumin reductase CurA